MALPPVVVNHGEKALVGLVLVGALWSVVSTLTDEATVPTRSPQQIEADFATIEKAQREPGRPALTESKDVVGAIRDRFSLAADLPSKSVLAFLHEHVSVGEEVIVGPTFNAPKYFYGYVVGVPEIDVVDNIGSFDVTITLPESERTDGRIQDRPAAYFSRNVVGSPEPITNEARTLGVIVERGVEQDGETTWQPLAEVGNPEGFIALDGNRGQLNFTLDDINEWQVYRFRARLVVAATAFDYAKPETAIHGKEVLVFSEGSRMPANQRQWDEALQLVSKMALDVLPAIPQTTVPTSALDTMPDGSLLFQGDTSDEVSLLAKSSVRFVLARVSPAVQAGKPPVATFQLTRQKNGQWVPPQEFKVPVGEALGDANHIFRNPANGGRREALNLETPFVLDSVDLQATRVMWFELTNKSDGQGGRRLELRENRRPSQTATLKNTVTGELLVMTRLERRLNQRPETQLFFNYPKFTDGKRNELDDFAKDPQGFTQPELEPEAPLERPPGDPWLAKQFPERDDLKSLEVPFWQFPDGRVIIIEPLNPKLTLTETLPGFDQPGASAPVEGPAEGEAPAE